MYTWCKNLSLVDYELPIEYKYTCLQNLQLFSQGREENISILYILNIFSASSINYFSW